MLPLAQTATLVSWALSPQWLTFTEACALSGHSLPVMFEIVCADGVDLDAGGRIEKQSLWQFLEAEALVSNWDG